VSAGVGCAAAVINAALGRNSSSCCCIIEQPESANRDSQAPADRRGSSCC
jgi:hypothetical protein